MLLEFGTDFNQGRYDPELLAAQERAKEALGTSVLAELVVLFAAPLVAGNRVTPPGAVDGRAVVDMRRSDVAEAWRGATAQLLQTVGAALGGSALPDQGPLRLRDGDLGAVAHEVGTLRMGEGVDGVVDPDLRMHGWDNAFVCDPSVFPTSPAANPTLTLVALADRLARHLAIA